MEDPVLHVERNLYGYSLAGLLWERQFEKILLKYGWEKVFNWEGLFVNRARGLLLSVYVDDIKFAGKTENKEPTWKILMEDVDLWEPTSFLDHVFLVCTQREYQTSKDIVDNYRSMFASRISARAKKYQVQGTWREHFLMVLWHGRSCKRNLWKDTANWRTKQNNSTLIQCRNSMHGWPPL